MSIETRLGAAGTSVTQSYPWGVYLKARVMCPDGKVRSTSRISCTADTFFSVPCAVKVRGTTVSGYMTFAESPSGQVGYQFKPTSQNACRVFRCRQFKSLADIDYDLRYRRAIVVDESKPAEFF